MKTQNSLRCLDRRPERRPGRLGGSSAHWEPADWQERHHPTEAVRVRVTAGRSTVLCRRRKQDARIWGRLNDVQMKAAERIDQAWRVVTGCVAAARSIYSDCGGRANAPAPEASQWVDRLLADYYAWVRGCRRDGVDLAAVLGIVALGQGYGSIERARGRKNGWARENLLQALDLYCGLKGWN